ncbi:MAG TPA: carbohydrate ABC transporter permease [Candidatus Avimonoglobus intestinipullorum]|uniref:Carbohydrate ABC transporter permease n=1 Tax=Candidatus Avimonoglobus intestinipullorum TaxID=2840699 RepID=A0A9D1S6C4_9FIRM|nr:carbohydrate ABC transporter permease [Candidatus Avimonoglobus intestinipullorum]
MRMKRSFGERCFDAINIIIMLLVVFVTLYPLWYVLVASLSSGTAVTNGEVVWWIKDFELEAYRRLFADSSIWIAYANTIFYSVVGTALSLVLTSLGAYVLSKKRLRGRKLITGLILLSMWFAPGTMPTYISFRNLGLLDTRVGILLLGAVQTFYVILMRSYFESIPDSMEEAAKIDGASDFKVFLNVYLPLSVASIITVGLYYFVQRWNSYFWAMILLKDPNKIPLQVLLKKYVVEMTANNSELANIDYTVTSRETTIFSTIVISTLPMIILYPFIQKFFVKGVMVGAVKG